MEILIDRSKGREHILAELRRRRDEAGGMNGMDMVDRIQLRCMEMEEAEKEKKQNSGYQQKYWNEVQKTRRLEQELAEIRKQQEFDAAVEKAVAERMGKTETSPATETTETTEIVEIA